MDKTGQLWSVLSKRKHEAQFPVSFGVAEAASEAIPQDLRAQRSSFRCVHLEECFLVQMRTGDLEVQSHGRLETGWDPGLLPIHAVLALPSLFPFSAFCLEKGWVALFFPPLPVSLHLIYIIQLETHGWLVYFYSGDLTWTVFGESGIFRKEEFCFAPSFLDRSFTLVLICVTVLGVIPCLRIFSLGCVSGQ